MNSRIIILSRDVEILEIHTAERKELFVLESARDIKLQSGGLAWTKEKAVPMREAGEE